MVNYTCDTCQKSFTQKSGFDSHKKRKTPCKPPGNQIPVSSVTVKPILKWVGGKTQILDVVLSKFPKEIQNYHEPFLGGGSVLLGLLNAVKSGSIKVSGTMYASDLNKHLINLYTSVQQNPTAVNEELKSLRTEFEACNGLVVNRSPTTIEEGKSSRESYYYWTRSRFNSLPVEQQQTPLAAALLIFLNKTCFRGVYREGPHGFNVPYGNNKTIALPTEDQLKEFSDLVQPVVFQNQGFQESLSRVQPGDFVYLDPPYAPETDTSFVSYTADGFGLDNHKQLFALVHTARQKGVKIVLSNAEVKLIKEAFPSPLYTTQVLSCRRAIHSKNPGSKTNEVLITNA